MIAKFQTRRDFLKALGLGAATLAVQGCTETSKQFVSRSSDHPNIIFIMADDLGFGDITCYNPDSKIPTPNIDRLAEQGVSFTDAHSPSSVCTPTRYGVLTGRYCRRSRLKRGVFGGFNRHLIEKDRLTVASLLKKHGYGTACNCSSSRATTVLVRVSTATNPPATSADSRHPSGNADTADQKINCSLCHTYLLYI